MGNSCPILQKGAICTVYFHNFQCYVISLTILNVGKTFKKSMCKLLASNNLIRYFGNKIEVDKTHHNLDKIYKSSFYLYVGGEFILSKRYLLLGFVFLFFTKDLNYLEQVFLSQEHNQVSSQFDTGHY